MRTPRRLVLLAGRFATAAAPASRAQSVPPPAARLQSCGGTLQKPGLPTETNPQDQVFFSTHIEKTTLPTATEATAPKASKKRNQ